MTRRLVYLAAASLTAAALAAPLWGFAMSAPQYPDETLHLQVVRTGIVGDVHEVTVCSLRLRAGRSHVPRHIGPGQRPRASESHLRFSLARCALFGVEVSGQSTPAGLLQTGHHGREYVPNMRAMQVTMP